MKIDRYELHATQAGSYLRRHQDGELVQFDDIEAVLKMKLDDLAGKLHEIDPFAGTALREAMEAAAKADGGLMLPETVILLLATNVAAWRRNAVARRAAADSVNAT
jgi:hypothetical protein